MSDPGHPASWRALEEIERRKAKAKSRQADKSKPGPPKKLKPHSRSVRQPAANGRGQDLRRLEDAIAALRKKEKEIQRERHRLGKPTALPESERGDLDRQLETLRPKLEKLRKVRLALVDPAKEHASGHRSAPASKPIPSPAEKCCPTCGRRYTEC